MASWDHGIMGSWHRGNPDLTSPARKVRVSTLSFGANKPHRELSGSRTQITRLQSSDSPQRRG